MISLHLSLFWSIEMLSYVLCSEKENTRSDPTYSLMLLRSVEAVWVCVAPGHPTELLLVSSWWRSGEGGQGAVIILVTLTRESHSHTSTRSTEVLSFDINMLPHHSLWLLMLFCWRSLLYTLKIFMKSWQKKGRKYQCQKRGTPPRVTLAPLVALAVWRHNGTGVHCY